MPRLPRSALRCIACAFSVASFAFCEQLPIRSYSTADGLPSNDINAIKRDSHGFLWFATDEGLARFNGYEFITYGRENGLPRDAVLDLLETRSGDYWVATPDGIAKFQPDAPTPKKFTAFRPQGPAEWRRVRVLYQGQSGTIWCGTEGGLLRLRMAPGKRDYWQFEPVTVADGRSAQNPGPSISFLREDNRGDLWIGTRNALYRRTRDGRLFEYRVKPRVGLDFLWNDLYQDRSGRLWAATGFGLWRILPTSKGNYKLIAVYAPKRRMAVWQIVEDGSCLWLATSDGLIQWTADERDHVHFRLYTQANGLTGDNVTALCRDREEHLWIGADGAGAMRIMRDGFVTYTRADHASFGKFEGGAVALFRDNQGEVHPAFHHVIDILHGNRFQEITPAIPKPDSRYFGWGWHQTIVHDRDGEWWIPTAEGVVRFPNVPVEALARAQPKAVYTTRNGLRTNDIFRLYEDSQGGIWVACIGPSGTNGLSRWNRNTRSFQHFPEHTSSVATAFAEDTTGTVWVGFWDGILGRHREGKLQLFDAADGLAGGGIQALHTDGQGRLWIGSLRGLTLLKTPSDPQPHFDRFGTRNGLSSNAILCLAEDPWGGIYAATGRGLDRIPPDGRITPSAVRHYTHADGLAKGALVDILFDRSGFLWCATRQGISRFRPPKENHPSVSPPVYIEQVRVRGRLYRSWDLGATFVPRLTFAPAQNQLQINFAGLAFSPGAVLKYQYKLEPADKNWSEPSDERAVNYSNLNPGDYRFQVRLVTDGALQSAPAAVELTVLAPLWQRWWFRLALALLIGGMVFWLHHYRAMRLVELERIRTRIATDLHDDIGSGLSQIAVLAEIACRSARDGRKFPDLDRTLSNIGSVSRQLSESMSDIVWSVNPKRDNLGDLVQRMRRFSSDVLDNGKIELHFRGPAMNELVPIPAGMRRELYLIFKEAVTNAVRHSECTEATIEISLDHNLLSMTIDDNGRGFSEGQNDSGNGLRSIRQRAQRMGASIHIDSHADAGTRVLLQVPLATRLQRLRA